MQILYFAWLRERVGKAAEAVELPASVTTPRGLIAWLRGQGAGYELAFANEALIRCAIDQEFAPLDAPFGHAAEVAFFPPVTGG